MRDALGADAVHVWRVIPDALPLPEAVLARTLSADERAQATRLRRPQDRQAWIATRGLLRVLLGHHLGRDPAALQFASNAFGKPALITAQNPGDVRFNVSHTEGLALLAVTRGREVGVDVERVREGWPVTDVASFIFSPRELMEWNALPPEARAEAFWTMWVRREARAKAGGTGLSLPGSAEEVPPSGSWALTDLDVGPAHRAALAVIGPGCPILLRTWGE
ncbi:MAG: 4'-phosphopantetheinyl transferase superfamily protein [Armatimonadetes bacterium]|nr:4'-phosphopantetheinyl transferase superfamily protein [Armatimonadota bacterium]